METVVVDAVARQWLECEWLAVQGEARSAAARRRLDDCPVVHLLPDLLRLADSCHDRSVLELRDPIQRMISESVFTDSNGDTMDALADPDQVDLLVEVVVRTLSKVRADAVERGAWSSEPAAIPMCG